MTPAPHFAKSGTRALLLLAAALGLLASAAGTSLADPPSDEQKAKSQRLLGPEFQLLGKNASSVGATLAIRIGKGSFFLIDQDRTIHEGQDELLVDPTQDTGKLCLYHLRTKALVQTILRASDRKIFITCVQAGTDEYKPGGYTKFNVTDPVIESITCRVEDAKRVLTINEVGATLGTYGTFAATLPKTPADQLPFCNRPISVVNEKK